MLAFSIIVGKIVSNWLMAEIHVSRIWRQKLCARLHLADGVLPTFPYVFRLRLPQKSAAYMRVICRDMYFLMIPQEATKKTIDSDELRWLPGPFSHICLVRREVTLQTWLTNMTKARIKSRADFNWQYGSLNWWKNMRTPRDSMLCSLFL